MPGVSGDEESEPSDCVFRSPTRSHAEEPHTTTEEEEEAEYYVVTKGKTQSSIGMYSTWAQAQQRVHGVPGTVHKK